MALQLDVSFDRKKGMGKKNTFLLLNNVISMLDLFKILTYTTLMTRKFQKLEIRK